MIAQTQLGSAEVAGNLLGATQGYLTTVFENVIINDSTNAQVTTILIDDVIINDSILSNYVANIADTIAVKDTVLVIGEDGTRLGEWRRTSKSKGLWRRIC